VLETRAITVRFGGQTALDGVSLVAADGEITGLIGPNGAGKTTMFDVITGLRRPQGGSVRLDDRDVTKVRPHLRARAGLARTFQSLQLFGTLTVRENILLGVPGGSRRAREQAADRLIDVVGLGSNADRLAQSLPTGTGRLVELGRALAGEPRFLLLDEPASGQSAEETAGFKQLMRRIAADGVGILLVEHDVPLVMDVCSMIHVLDFGRLIASGPPATIRDDRAVQAAYLGVERGAA